VDSTTTYLANGTEGAVIRADDENIVDKFNGILELVSSQPISWIGEGYVGRVNVDVVLDGSGSFDQLGYPIESYDWDVDGDGGYDVTTKVPTVTVSKYLSRDCESD
jgi:hypothetical protein